MTEADHDHSRCTPEAAKERAAWTRDIARMLREQTEVKPELRAGYLDAAEWLDPSYEAPEGPGAAEWLARQFHEAYERLAPNYGYETREASAKPWAEVPENNRNLMEATVSDLIRTGHVRPGSKFRPIYPDRNENYVPPGLDVERDSGRRVEISEPREWLSPEWLREMGRLAAEHIEVVWAQVTAGVECGAEPVPVELGPLFAWLKLYKDYAERDEPPAMARLELAGADEFNGGRHGSWWWVDVGGAGTHWSEFKGHRVQIDIELHTSNRREINEWKGRDEIRPGGKWLLKFDRQVVAGDYVGRDPLRTLDLIRRRAEELMEHPALHHGDPRPYAEQLMYRRVYYDRTPAVVVGTVLDQGCVILQPVGVEQFPMSLYDYDRPDDSIDDPYERTTAKVELWYPPVHWHRDRLVEGEPTDAEAWAALITQERAEEEERYAEAVAAKRERYVEPMIPKVYDKAGSAVPPCTGCGVVPCEDGRCACLMPEAPQVAGSREILAQGTAQPSGEAVPIDVEDDDTADDEPAVDPAGAGESSGRWQPLCACLGRPGCYCRPDEKPVDGA